MFSETQPLIGNSVERRSASKKCQKSLAIYIIGAILLAVSLISLVIYFYPASVSNSTKKAVSSRLKEEYISLVAKDAGLTDVAKASLITSLPGLTVDINDLGFNMFSGYIEVDHTTTDGIELTVKKELFYWFHECDCESPDEQPLILWTNGGPGCSGMEGNLVEHGPLLIQSDFTLSKNDYSWNKLANVIYIEQPFGVGYSSPSEGEVVSGDLNAAKDMDSFLRHFLEQYPKYINNKVIISSESWGGHYMPMTAYQILTNNAAGTTPYINFEGLLVGNPYTDYFENRIGWMEALYGHGLLQQSTYDTWRELCYGNLPDLDNADCSLNYIQSYIDSINVDYYALDYPSCSLIVKAEKDAVITPNVMEDDSKSTTKFRWFQSFLTQRVETLYNKFKDDMDMTDETKLKFENALSEVKGASNIPYIACADDYMATYLNRADVQEAVHAKDGAIWAMCSDAVYDDWPEQNYFAGMESVYNSLLYDFDTKIKIVIFSGDDDSVCGTPGTQYWLRNMGFDIDINYDWKEWKLDDELAGFYTRFLIPNTETTAIHFQTVRSAGHMVPQTQPKKGYYILDRYLNYFQ